MSQEFEREAWLDTNAICQYLSVGRHTLIRWVIENEFPAHKIGGRWRYRLSEVDKWIQRQSDEARSVNKK